MTETTRNLLAIFLSPFLASLLTQHLAADLIEVEGTIEANTTWTSDNIYRLTDNVTLANGAVLTIEAGVEVQSVTSGNAIYVGRPNQANENAGTRLISNGGLFRPSNQITVAAYAGASLDLANCEINDKTRLYLLDGASGSISNCSIAAPVAWDNSTTPILAGNTFTTSEPFTLRSGAGDLSGVSSNTYMTNSFIGVRGTLESSRIWGHVDGLSKYRLTDNVTLANGAVLTIEAGVEVQSVTSGNAIYVGRPNQANENTGTRLISNGGLFRPSNQITVAAYAGASLDLANCEINDKTRLYLLDGASGSISNCSIAAPVAWDNSTTPILAGNTFTTSEPFTLRSGAGDLSGVSSNTYMTNSFIGVRGTLESSRIWGHVDGLSKYRLTDNVTLANGAVLTIEAGVEVQSVTSGNAIYVGRPNQANENAGTRLISNGGLFRPSNQITVAAYAGASLDLANCEINDKTRLYLLDGASGSISNCSIAAPVAWDNSTTPILAGNTFTTSEPFTLRSGAGDLSGVSSNTYMTNSFIGVRGTLESSRIWGHVDGLSKYRLTDNVTLANGAVLTIEAGVEVQSVTSGNAIYVGRPNQANENTGTRLISNGGLFRPSNQITVAAYAGASLDLANCEINDKTHLYLMDLSQIVISGLELHKLTIYSGASANIRGNWIHPSGLTVKGLADSTIDLAGNWWGSADPADVESELVHNPDSAQLPTVLYEPILISNPAQLRREADIIGELRALKNAVSGTVSRNAQRFGVVQAESLRVLQDKWQTPEYKALELVVLAGELEVDLIEVAILWEGEQNPVNFMIKKLLTFSIDLGFDIFDELQMRSLRKINGKLFDYLYFQGIDASRTDLEAAITEIIENRSGNFSEGPDLHNRLGAMLDVVDNLISDIESGAIPVADLGDPHLQLVRALARNLTSTTYSEGILPYFDTDFETHLFVTSGGLNQENTAIEYAQGAEAGKAALRIGYVICGAVVTLLGLVVASSGIGLGAGAGLAVIGIGLAGAGVTWSNLIDVSAERWALFHSLKANRDVLLETRFLEKAVHGVDTAVRSGRDWMQTYAASTGNISEIILEDVLVSPGQQTGDITMRFTLENTGSRANWVNFKLTTNAMIDGREQVLTLAGPNFDEGSNAFLLDQGESRQVVVSYDVPSMEQVGTIGKYTLGLDVAFGNRMVSLLDYPEVADQLQFSVGQARSLTEAGKQNTDKIIEGTIADGASVQRMVDRSFFGSVKQATYRLNATNPNLDLGIYDESNRFTGREPSTGSDLNQIPGANYSGSDAIPEIISIKNPEGNYQVVVRSRITSQSPQSITSLRSFEMATDGDPYSVTMTTTPQYPPIMSPIPVAIETEWLQGQNAIPLEVRFQVSEIGGSSSLENASLSMDSLTGTTGNLPTDRISINGDLSSVPAGSDAIVTINFDLKENDPLGLFEGTWTLQATGQSPQQIPVAIRIVSAPTRWPFGDASQRDNGWKTSEWFGWFHDGPRFPWLYHAKNGWQYIYGKDASSIFLYDMAHGSWYWTSAQIYPIHYKFGSAAGWYKEYKDQVHK